MKISESSCEFRVWSFEFRTPNPEPRTPNPGTLNIPHASRLYYCLLLSVFCLLVACCLLFSGCGGGGGGDAATTSTSGSGGGNPVTSTSCASGGSTGSISVSSKPGGASIYVDGADTGQTTPTPSGSVTLSNITEGAHTVKLSLSGWSDSETAVCVSASSVQTVPLELRPSTDFSNSI